MNKLNNSHSKAFSVHNFKPSLFDSKAYYDRVKRSVDLSFCTKVTIFQGKSLAEQIYLNNLNAKF